MKATLSSAATAKQFRVEIKKGDRRFTFYLGSDIKEAEERKASLYRFTNTLTTWDESSIEIAKTIAKGERVRVRAEEQDEDTNAKIESLIRRGVHVRPVVTMDDLQQAEVQLLRDRIAELEAELRETAGPRVAQRSTITMYDVCDEWHKYRRSTAVIPGTSKPKDAVETEGTVVAFIKRMIEPPALKLNDLDYAAIDIISKRIASRPLGLRGTIISRPWAKESLKVWRRILKYAISTYGYRAPTLWHEATKATITITPEDQRRRRKLKEMIFTTEEIRTLFRYSIPSERLVLLLGLNCGFRQSEQTGLQDDEIVGDVIDRYRGKTDIYAQWKLWPETIKALAENDRPDKRGSVTDSWKRLVTRVQKDQPNFRWRSVKWLCKTGSSKIKAIAGADIATMYLSHGERNHDDLLTDYAADDWSKLSDALSKWRDELALDSIATTNERTALPLSSIDRCKAMWRDGSTVKEIMKATKMSRATCYRYRVPAE